MNMQARGRAPYANLPSVRPTNAMAALGGPALGPAPPTASNVPLLPPGAGTSDARRLAPSAAAAVTTAASSVPVPASSGRGNPPAPPRLLTELEAEKTLLDVFAWHEERATCLKRSKELNQNIQRAKPLLATYMRHREQDRMTHANAGRYFTTREVMRPTKVGLCDLLGFVERDFGAEARQRYEVELEALSKTKHPVLESKITYSGLRTAGQHNPGALQRGGAGTNKRGRTDDQ